MLTVRTTLKEAGKKGIGLFADQTIKKGDKVWEFNNLLDIKLHPSLVQDAASEVQKEFIEKYGTKEKDGRWMVDIDNTRFLNHSNRPNLLFVDDRVAYAIYDIEIGEELTCDYHEVCHIDKLDFVDVENEN